MVAIYLLISLIIFIVIGIIGVEIGDSTKIDYSKKEKLVIKSDSCIDEETSAGDKDAYETTETTETIINDISNREYPY